MRELHIIGWCRALTILTQSQGASLRLADARGLPVRPGSDKPCAASI